MASYSINVKQDLAGTMQRHILKTPLVRNNQYAHVFNVEVTNNGVPYPVGSVEANFVQSNGMTVPLDSTYCSSSGNVATVRLPQACYTVPGRAILVINCEADGGITCIAWFDCTVLNGSTENALDPGTIIPSVETLIDRIDEAVESIPADYSQLLASISDNFSAETPCAAGAYVWGPSNATHPGALYRFTSAHSGSWVETDATIVVIGNELNDTVRYTPQVHTDAEKAVARTNMGAAAAADLTALSNSVGTVPSGTTVENQIFAQGTQISTNASNIDALQRQVGTVPTGETVEGQIGDLKSAIDVLEPTATAEDEGKALIVKTVTSGKVSEYEFGTAGEGLTEAAKVALLNCFAHVAWIDEHGQDYYDALETALYPTTDLVSMTAVFTQGSFVVYPSTPLNDLKAYLTVTGYYNDGRTRPVTDYALSGTLAVGTSTITISKDGVTTTFTVAVTAAPYWDYEWDASSKTLPEGMTARSYDFTTEDGVLFTDGPNLDFDYIGNCIIEVEMKVYCHNDTQEVYGTNNPQIQIINESLSNSNYRGIKIVFYSAMSGSSSSPKARVAAGINGINSLISGLDAAIYHTYRIEAQNNVYAFSVDGDAISLTQNQNTTNWLNKTGIAAALDYPIDHYCAYIKSIKFKELN